MNSKLRDIVVLVALSLALVWCIPAMGQVIKGSISGTVTDPQNAVVSGATVKATHSDTGAVYTTTSDSSGLFRFNLIPAGNYKVEVSSQGFKTSVENNIAVTAGADRSLGSIKLAVGETNTTVEVAAAAPLIDTNQSQVTNTFSGVQLQTFTGIQENEGLDNLALFVPGINNTRDQTFSNSNGPGFSVDGLRGRNNDQEIDGQNNNDNSVGGPGLFLSDSEFVQQYVLVTNQFGPEYGRNAGSVVNIITKSGANAWHGSLFGYENNSVLNSLTNNEKRFEGLTQPPRLNSEFGGFTIGGPMVKNKMFIFGGFDQQIVSQNTVYSAGTLTPTPAGIAQLNGCFPGSTSLAAFNKFGPYAISAGNPTPLAGTATTVDVGSCTGVPFAGIERNLSTPVHIFDWVLRHDIQLGGDTLTSRYIFNRSNNFNTDPGGDGAVLGYPINVTGLSQAILESWTHNFGAHMVNEARVSFGRLNVDFGGNQIGNTVPTAGNLQSALAQATIGPTAGFLELFGTPNNIPQSRIVNTWQAQDNWNYVLGKHQLKAGVNWTYQRSPNIFLPNINGTYRFTTWDSVVANTPNRVRVGEGTPSLDFREYDTFVYGGDDWKISQSLTLNLGLTWTYYGQPENLFHTLSVAQQTGSNPFWNPALPQSVTTSPTIPAVKNSFGPSVGFAYSPQWGGWLLGHGKTTFRGGVRMLYDPPFYNIYINESSSAPNVFLDSFTGSTPTKAKTLPIPAVPTGPNVRASLQPFLTPGVLDPRTQAETNVTPNFGPDKVNAASFGFERELTKNSAFEARWAGNRAYDLFQTFNGNPFIGGLAAAFPQFTTGLTPCPATQQVGLGAGSDVGRVNCGQGILRSRGNGGFSYYNGVQLEFRTNNLFKQLTIRTGYTWSKTLDNVSEIFATGGGGNTTPISQNPLNAGLPEKSFSGLDYPNAWTLIFTEQLPFFKEQHGFMGHLMGGWAFSGSYLLISGQRYTPSQVQLATATAGDLYDVNFWANFIGFEPARPFLGNLHAPATAVGIYAGDGCAFFSLTGTDPLCTGSPTQLVSLSAVGASGCESNATIACPFVPVTKDQVRFIANTGIAQTVFGTPFGNTPRNVVQDAMTNIANFSVYKSVKLGERANFEFRTSFLNAFNHPNFASIDPFMEDAGFQLQGTGFGDPTLTNSTPRTILFGGKISF
jgi:hypothetical protein